jgi:hypothetical protein
MAIRIRPEQDQTIGEVLDEWAQHLERAVRDHFPALGLAREQHDHEVFLLLSEKGAARGEIVLRWDRAAPHELSIYPQPVREAAASKAKGDALAMRVAVACVIAVCAVWFGIAAGLWSEFMKMADMRDKMAIVLIGVLAWIVSTSGLALLAYHLVRRSHRAIDLPRAERSRQWVESEIEPWLLAVLDEALQRARTDPGLARRLAADV